MMKYIKIINTFEENNLMSKYCMSLSSTSINIGKKWFSKHILIIYSLFGLKLAMLEKKSFFKHTLILQSLFGLKLVILPYHTGLQAIIISERFLSSHDNKFQKPLGIITQSLKLLNSAFFFKQQKKLRLKRGHGVG